MTNHVVLIDDEITMRRSLEQWLALSDLKVSAYSNGHDALKLLAPDFAGIVVSDVKMPQIDGMELMEAVHQIDPEIPVILMTGHGQIAMAVEAMKRSAYDFLEKPFSPEQLLDTAKRALEHRNLLLENRALRQRLAEASGLSRRLIGDSPQIKKLRHDIADLASTNVSVLLSGETGSGKEVVARALHDFGDRSGKSFVAINCGAIPEALFESELFGHVAGAFTGAQSAKEGAFEYADGGTLFLDEITSLPQAMQVKLLRVLQERHVIRVGTNKPVPFDVRIISASNENIADAVQADRFRSDLYYRINTIELQAPPLRDRGDDIELLFTHFIKLAEQEFGRVAPELQAADHAALRTHKWPGNVRELKNAAERFTLARQTGRRGSFEIMSGTSTLNNINPTSLTDQMNEFEKNVISQALEKCGGNIADVMTLLNIPRRTLNEKMLRHGLSKDDFKASNSQKSAEIRL
ncbi:MAG: sigma-54 dependent transcriptional regulator [Hyphomicrobiales bacterium]